MRFAEPARGQSRYSGALAGSSIRRAARNR